VGKTTIALQLVVATARGTDWLGAVVNEHEQAWFLSAEEDQDEAHRRLAAIVEHHGVDFRDLAGVKLICLPGEDAVLGHPDKNGAIRPTPLLDRLEQEAIRARPALIAIEAAADVFAGSENDRSQVRQFVGLLRRMAIRSGAAVLLLSHPSLAGLSSGTGTSGSTGWNNSVRSRLYLTSARTQDGEEPDPELRELKVMKSNYGPAGETVRLRWRNGVFVPESKPSVIERAAAEATVDDMFLRLLDAAAAQGRRVGPNTGKNYAPSVFEAMPTANGIKSKGFAKAMERLLAAGKVKVQPIGPASKQRDVIVRVDRNTNELLGS
jgi:RecA-family ATPase